MHNTYTALDTETTGLKNHPTLGHPEIVQLSLLPVAPDLTVLQTYLEAEGVEKLFLKLTEEAVTENFMPTQAIDSRATDVHGLTRRNLTGSRKTSQLALPEGCKVILAHNAAFDYRCLGKPEGIELICTMKLAKKLDKQLDLGAANFKLVTLIEHFYGEEAKEVTSQAHQAETDTVMVVLLLLKLLEYMPNIKTMEGLQTSYKLLTGTST